MKQQPKLDWLKTFFKRANEVGYGTALFEIYDTDSRVKTDLRDWRSAPGPLHLDHSPPGKAK